MKKLKTFAQKKPILILLLLMIFALIVFYAPTEKLYLHFYNIKYSTFLGQLTNDMIVSIVLIIVLIKLCLIKGTGITVFPNSWKDWFIAWPLMIILLLSFLPLITGGITLDTNPSIVSIFIIMNFFVGLAEELLFRGVILSLLLIKWGNTRKGIYMCYCF